MKAELLSVREYAASRAITEQAAYKKVKAGKLQTVTIQENGKQKLYIILPAGDPEPGPLPEVSDPDTETPAGSGPRSDPRSGPRAAAAGDPSAAATPEAAAAAGDPQVDNQDPAADPPGHHSPAADPDPEQQPPRARAGTQETAESEMIKALINQLDAKDKQIAELTEIVRRFQELQAGNLLLLEQHTAPRAAAAAGDPSEVIITEPAPEAAAAAGDPQVDNQDPPPDPAPPLTFRQKIRKFFFDE